MVKYAIISSKKDKAGLSIQDAINHIGRKPSDNFTQYLIDEESYASEQACRGLSEDFLIFATRHQSIEKKPCLCVHVPGNWNDVGLGGLPQKLCIAPASLLKAAYLKLKEKNIPGFDVTMECTHHGPCLDKPCMFIEIGSTENEWGNPEAARIIAETIMEITSHPITESKSVVGIGGPHYCNNFNKLMERTDYAVGHVCPKYMLPYLTKEMILQAIERTHEKDPLVVIDWKGLGEHKQRIEALLKDVNAEKMLVQNRLRKLFSLLIIVTFK